MWYSYYIGIEWIFFKSLTVTSKVSVHCPPKLLGVALVSASTVLPVPWMLKVSKSNRSEQTPEVKEYDFFGLLGQTPKDLMKV